MKELMTVKGFSKKTCNTATTYHLHATRIRYSHIQFYSLTKQLLTCGVYYVLRKTTSMSIHRKDKGLCSSYGPTREWS